MESDSRTRSQKIIETLEGLINLIYKSEDSFSPIFSEYFKKILEKLTKPHDLYKICEEIMGIYGGMGSFCDVVLMKNLEVLREEQKEFDKLSLELFELCQDIIVEQRGGLTIQDFDGEYFIPIERVKEIKRVQNNRLNNTKNDFDNPSE